MGTGGGRRGVPMAGALVFTPPNNPFLHPLCSNTPPLHPPLETRTVPTCVGGRSLLWVHSPILGIWVKNNTSKTYWTWFTNRPVHAKLSHSALSSRAHLGAGWELNFQLFGSSSSSVSMAPMDPNFQLWLRLRGSGSLRAVSLHKST